MVLDIVKLINAMPDRNCFQMEDVQIVNQITKHTAMEEHVFHLFLGVKLLLGRLEIDVCLKIADGTNSFCQMVTVRIAYQTIKHHWTAECAKKFLQEFNHAEPTHIELLAENVSEIIAQQINT